MLTPAAGGYRAEEQPAPKASLPPPSQHKGGKVTLGYPEQARDALTATSPLLVCALEQPPRQLLANSPQQAPLLPLLPGSQTFCLCILEGDLPRS